MTTEEQLEDFYKKLSRPDFEEMIRLMDARFTSSIPIEVGEREIFLSENGWSRDEYLAAHHARTQREIEEIDKLISKKYMRPTLSKYRIQTP